MYEDLKSALGDMIKSDADSDRRLSVMDRYLTAAEDIGTHEGAIKAAQTRKAHGGWNPKFGFKETEAQMPHWNSQAPKIASTIQHSTQVRPTGISVKTNPVNPQRSSPFAKQRAMSDWLLRLGGDMWIG